MIIIIPINGLMIIIPIEDMVYFTELDDGKIETGKNQIFDGKHRGFRFSDFPLSPIH